MKLATLFIAALCILGVTADDDDEGKPQRKFLSIGVTKSVPAAECKYKTRKYDQISIHYIGKKYSDGTQFENTRDSGAPFEFTLGAGQVIKGLDQGLLNMCVGEHRKLIVPSVLGADAQSKGPQFPKYMSLVFYVELMGVKESKDEL